MKFCKFEDLYDSYVFVNPYLVTQVEDGAEHGLTRICFSGDDFTDVKGEPQQVAESISEKMR